MVDEKWKLLEKMPTTFWLTWRVGHEALRLRNRSWNSLTLIAVGKIQHLDLVVFMWSGPQNKFQTDQFWNMSSTEFTQALSFGLPRPNRPLPRPTLRTQEAVALRDWEFMKKCQLQGQQDPFLVSSTKMIDYDVINELLEDIADTSNPARSDLSHLRAASQPDQTVPLFGGSRTLTNKRHSLKGFLQRLSMAILGGGFLIAPMFIMVYHPGRVSTLATSSAFVFAFGVVMSFYLDRPFDVLSGTAAYAAVLVVFVGASQP
ncbi:hypothetical protein B0T22DRAFT_444978 [Podospora appendiculata]|uniref:DUF6594 domain-containing protein n=1 Tax=Podospora appendiculata TaxID=314037 RepID=A0AAE0X1S6_9PEZI|nr:hypothetical protein B0T22DRAFT_444978 [Podospora appendiculata]